MTVAIAPALGFGAQRFLNNLQGITPNVNGQIFTYQAATSTLQATFTDSSGATANPNPIILDANGRVPNEIWFTQGQVYKLVETDQFGTTIGTWDNVPATASAADIANLQAQITAFSTSITTGALTVTGATTLNALSVGAITGTGSVNIGTNTLTCGAITSTGASTLGSLTLGGNLAMGGNSITGVANITATGTITAAAFSSSAAAPSWAFNNAAARGTNGIVNYQTQSQLNANTYSAGTITVGTGNTGNYLVMASAEVGYNGGVSGAQATLEIFKNGASTGFKSSWQENNNTTEHATIAISAIINTTAGTDTIAVQFTTTANGSVFSGSGTFVGKLL